MSNLFCPNCGTPALTTDQRYCKSCGTNLQIVNDALEKGDTKQEGNKDLKSLGLEFASTIADTIKESIGDVAINKHPHRAQKHAEWAKHRQVEIEKWKARHEERLKRREERKAEQAKPQMPKPKEWLAYSRQHNLKHGLITLLGGGGFGLFLYYAGKMALESGLVQQIEDAAQQHPVVGLEFGLKVVWMIAAIPILKGLGQLIYAAFFAESIKTLAERFAPPPSPTVQTENSNSKTTAPQTTSPIFESLAEPPPSVTEGTTNFLSHDEFLEEAETAPQDRRTSLNRSASERG